VQTLHQALLEATRRITRPGRNNPRQQARWMLEAVTGLPVSRFPAERDRELTPEQETILQGWLDRSARGEPLQYILGTQEFRRLTLRTDRRALIPRPETEGLVDWALEAVRDLPHPAVLDVGTGSGAIILALAAEHSGMTGWGCDASAEALSLARENGKFTGLEKRITWVQADLHDPAFPAAFGRRFDLVLSNPPYVSEAEYPELPDEVRDWEPASALLAGPEGLDAIARLARVGGELLTPAGSLIIEISERQGYSSTRLFETYGWHVLIGKDLSGKDRYLRARAG